MSTGSGNFSNACLYYAVLLCLTALYIDPAWANGHACATGERISGTVADGGRSELFTLEGQTQKYGLAGIYTDQSEGLSGALDLYVQNGTDRYGRKLVQVFDTGQWIQGQFLERGKGLHYALGVTGACLAAFKQAENQAKGNKRGIWLDGSLPFTADQLNELHKNEGKFVVVKGEVLSIGNRAKRVYLNFGQNWSQDFTVSVVKGGKGAFKGKLDRLLGLKNKTVQVRGILEEQQGPLLRLFDEAQIDIID